MLQEMSNLMITDTSDASCSTVKLSWPLDYLPPFKLTAKLTARMTPLLTLIQLPVAALLVCMNAPCALRFESRLRKLVSYVCRAPANVFECPLSSRRLSAHMAN